MTRSGPTQFIFNNDNNNNKTKKIQNKFQGSFQNIYDFSHVFPTILYNIELYIYIIRYKSSIKISSFLWNVTKKIENKIKLKKILISSLKKQKIFVFVLTTIS
jgi:hypothetical protein